MKILIVVHGLPPQAQGGSEIYADTHARALIRQFGDDVVVLTRESDPALSEYSVRREQRDGLPIVWINNTFRDVRSFEETYRNPSIDAIAARLIDELRPDVAHIHHLTCLSTGIVDELARREIPTFLTLHDYWLICHRGQLLDRDLRVCDGPGPDGCDRCLGPEAGLGPSSYAAASVFRSLEPYLPEVPVRLVRRTAAHLAGSRSGARGPGHEPQRRVDHMRGICAEVTRFLAPSRYLRDRFVRFGVPDGRIGVVALGLDPAQFRRREPTVSTQLRIGFLGTLMVSKAPDVLLEAFSRLPAGSASVDLFGAYSPYHGDDSYRARLEPLTALSGVRVHGSIPRAEVAARLAAIDVLVAPSIWPENSPLVIREAFLMGVPVVASAIGGIPEAVEEGRGGLLFRAGDVADLHRTLTRLLDEPGLLASLRATIPAVRSLEEDVGAVRSLYGQHVRTRAFAAGSSQAVSESPRREPREPLAAIVLNYRTPDDTFLAVKSLLSSRRPIDAIIVVNNDSVESPCRNLVSLGPGVSYLHTGRNLGFSGGVNVGIRAALASGAKRVLLVNSDVIVPPDCVARLEQTMETTPHAGIVAPMMVGRSDPDQVASLGISYSPRSGRMYHQGFGTPARSAGSLAGTVVDGVAGCLMLIRREVFDAVGLFDEAYFFSFEDLDFCLKARRAGFVSILSGATALHEGGRSIGPDSPSRLYFAARNHLLMARRADRSGNAARSLSRAVSILTLNVAHAVVASGGSLPARLGAVLRGTRDYVRGKWGEE